LVKWIKGIEFVEDFTHLGGASAATTTTMSSSDTGNPSERRRCRGASLPRTTTMNSRVRASPRCSCWPGIDTMQLVMPTELQRLLATADPGGRAV
jgi:hypothetical protein